MTDLCELTASELLAAYAAGEATPTEAVRSCLARIDEIEPSINAVVLTLAESALDAAADADARWVRGEARPLEGVPHGLKDIIATAGVTTTGGSALYRDHVPAEDAALAARLADAGGILLAKLQTFEFACGGAVNRTFGPTRNPWDLERTAGGSSSGSGAAVAAREMPLAIGTDTAGSIRIPSAFCGLTGLKATYGRVPRHGVMGLSWTLDHAGPMARSAVDCARMLAAIAGPDPRDPTSSNVAVGDVVGATALPVAGMRVGRLRGYLEELFHPPMLAAYTEALAEFADLGVEIVDVELPSADLVETATWMIVYAEMLSLHEGHLAGIEERDAMGAALLGAAPFVAAVDYLRALRLRPMFQRELTTAMAGCDALVLPGHTALPPRIGEAMTAEVGEATLPWLEVFCRTQAPFNLTGSPALVLPTALVAGMPTSLQLVGRPFDEVTLLRLGAAFQRATEHHTPRPPVLRG